MDEMMSIQKEKVRKELVFLCLGELAAALSFWFCFFLLKNRLGDVNSLVTILYSLSLLTFILLQGSIYWAILIRRLFKPQFGSASVPKLYDGFRILDHFIQGCIQSFHVFIHFWMPNHEAYATHIPVNLVKSDKIGRAHV